MQVFLVAAIVSEWNLFRDPVRRGQKMSADFYWFARFSESSEGFQNLPREKLVYLPVPWNGFGQSALRIVKDVVLASAAQQDATRLAKLRDQVATLHAIFNSPTLRIPGISSPANVS